LKGSGFSYLTRAASEFCHPAKKHYSSFSLSLPLQHLENLRNITMSEYQDITHRATLEYGNHQHWQREYKFLPNMTKPTSAVS